MESPVFFSAARPDWSAGVSPLAWKRWWPPSSTAESGLHLTLRSSLCDEIRWLSVFVDGPTHHRSSKQVFDCSQLSEGRGDDTSIPCDSALNDTGSPEFFLGVHLWSNSCSSRTNKVGVKVSNKQCQTNTTKQYGETVWLPVVYRYTRGQTVLFVSVTPPRLSCSLRTCRIGHSQV